MEEQMGGTEGQGRLMGQRGRAGWWDRGVGQVRMEEQRGGAG